MRFGPSRYSARERRSAPAASRGVVPAADPADMGYLTLGVSSGANALPLEGAEIVVEQNGVLLSQLITDEQGNSATVALPTPALEFSQQPGSVRLPYATVNIYVRFSGHFPSFYQGVQIFPNETSLLNVNLIPHPEDELTPDQQNYVIPEHNLITESEGNADGAV